MVTNEKLNFYLLAQLVIMHNKCAKFERNWGKGVGVVAFTSQDFISLITAKSVAMLIKKWSMST